MKTTGFTDEEAPAEHNTHTHSHFWEFVWITAGVEEKRIPSTVEKADKEV